MPDFLLFDTPGQFRDTGPKRPPETPHETLPRAPPFWGYHAGGNYRIHDLFGGA